MAPQGKKRPRAFLGFTIMTEFLIFVRNLVLAAIFALIGLQFAPQTPEQAPEDKGDSSVTLSLLP